MRWQRILICCGLLFTGASFAANYTVSDYASLVTAITGINASPGTCTGANCNTVTVTQNVIISGNLAPLQNGATFTGSSVTIDGNTNQFQLFATAGASVSFNGVSAKNGKASGGTASGNGGGGLGAGGGVFIDAGQTLSLTNSTISGNNATGGAGGTSSGTTGSTGGNASFGVNAGFGANSLTGYGGGSGASGSAGSNFGTTPPANGGAGGGAGTSNGSAASVANGGPGGNGSTSGGPGAGGTGGTGGYCGGAGGGGGGGGGNFNGSNWINGASGGGGAGGGGGGTTSSGGIGSAGSGGGGGSGSGLSGGASGSSGGGYGAGGNGGNQGNPGGGAPGGGGFGAGGGGGGTSPTFWGGAGGAGGGFGAGGGGGGSGNSGVHTAAGGSGGAYAGNGGTGSNAGSSGGAGASIGGGIFAAQNAILQIGDGVSISSNTVTQQNTGANPGSTLAPDLFLFKGAQLQFVGTTGYSSGSPFSTNIQGDVLHAGSSANYDSGVLVNTTSASTVITMTSSGNTYQGGTNIQKGVLSIASNVFPTTGTINIQANGALYLTGAFAPSQAIVNAGAINISAGAFTVPSSFTNTSGNIYVVGTGSISGASPAITAGNSLNIGKDSLGTFSANAFTAQSNITVTSINLYKNSSIATGAGTLSGNLFLIGNGNSFSGITGTTFTTGQDSFGTSDATTAFSASGAISGFLNISVAAGTFSNNGFAISGVNGTNGFTTAGGTTTTFSGTYSGSGPITNAGTMQISNSVTSGTFTNNGSLTLNTNTTLNSGANNFVNTGTLNVRAKAINVTAAQFNQTAGTQSYNITDTTNYDSLVVSGNVNISGGSIAVASSFVGPKNTQLSWPLITGSSVSVSGATISLPSAQWSSRVVGNVFTIFYLNGFLYSPYPGVNTKIYSVLVNMLGNNNQNPGQQKLLNAFLAANSQAAFNNDLHQMLPLQNAMNPSIAQQNAIFNKIETRLQQEAFERYAGNLGGIAAGDLNATTGMWIGSFGSRAKQQAYDDNSGYSANSFGAIIGFDRLYNDLDIFGLGFGISKTLVTEYSNPNFNSNTIGYHFLTYGTKDSDCSRFWEWLATGALTDTSGSRQINVSGVVMSTTSSFRGAQAAARLNYGFNFDFGNILTATPLLTSQYFIGYQPNYNEAYSPAALNVQPQNYQQVFTVGGGLRFSLPCDTWWLIGAQQFYALFTYDAISSSNNISANFVVGSENFVLLSSPQSRGAFRTGIDFAFEIFNNLQLWVSYDYQVRHLYYDNAGSIKLVYVF